MVFLSLSPWRFHNATGCIAVGVATSVDDVGHTVSELDTDISQPRLSARVFDGVVKKSRYHLVFVPTMIKNQGGHSQRMGDVGDGRPLAVVTGVRQGGIDEGDLKTA